MQKGAIPIAALLCWLIAVPARAQIYATRGNGVIELLRINLSTGVTTTIAMIPKQTEFLARAVTIDPVSRRYFLFFETYFVSVNVDTGASTIVPFANVYRYEWGGAMFDPVSGKIVAVLSVYHPGRFIGFYYPRLASIDPTTGAVTLRGPERETPFPIGVFDPDTRRVFFGRGPRLLGIANLDTLNVTTVAADDLSNLRHLEYDSATGKLIATRGEVLATSFVSIDPTTGKVEPLPKLGVFAWVESGTIATDSDFSSSSRLFVFRARLTVSVVNIETGAVTALGPEFWSYRFGGREAFAADVSLTKTTAASTVPAGGELVYHLTVHNEGPDAATGVVVTDPLPAGTAFVSATPSQGTVSFAGGTLTARLGTIPAGASATVGLITNPMGGTVVNTARVDASEADPDPLNNAASATAHAVVATPTLDLAALLCLAGALAVTALFVIRRL